MQVRRKPMSCDGNKDQPGDWEFEDSESDPSEPTTTTISPPASIAVSIEHRIFSTVYTFTHTF